MDATDAEVTEDGLCHVIEAFDALNIPAGAVDCVASDGNADRILLPAANFELPFQPLFVTRSVEIIGEGPDQTVLEFGSSLGLVVDPLSDATVQLTDLTLRQIPGLPAIGPGIGLEIHELVHELVVTVWNVRVEEFTGRGVRIVGDLEGNVDSNVTVEILDSAITDNRGGVLKFGASVLLDNSLIADNGGSEQGGGILHVDGTMTLVDCEIVNNSATDGGGIYSTGATDVIIESSGIEDNSASRGGGLWLGGSAPGLVHINASLIAENDATLEGGGIYNEGHPILESSTVSSNSAALGGGVYSASTGDTAFQSTTIAFNNASEGGGGVFFASGTEVFHFRNTIVAENFAPSGTGVDLNLEAFQSQNNTLGFATNLIGNSDTVRFAVTPDPDPVTGLVPHFGGTDLLDDAPGLAGLANAGGPTRTHPLILFSPAIDAGQSVVTEDQRGVTRPADGDGDGLAVHDIGAFERDPSIDGFPFLFLTEERVTNRGFEAGTQGWVGSFGTSISASTLQAHTGSRSLRVSQRNLGSWQGAVYDLLGRIQPGERANASAWARIAGDPSEPVLLTRRSICVGESTPRYQTVALATASSTGWVELDGTLFAPSCELSELIMYVEGPRPGVVLYVDDASAIQEGWVPDDSPLAGSFVTTTDWGTGYCVELKIQNPTAEPTTTWSASFDLNGTSIGNIWNLNASGSTGSVTVTPTAAWNSVIPAGGTSHSLGFCASRPLGGGALPGSLVVTGSF